MLVPDIVFFVLVEKPILHEHQLKSPLFDQWGKSCETTDLLGTAYESFIYHSENAIVCKHSFVFVHETRK